MNNILKKLRQLLIVELDNYKLIYQVTLKESNCIKENNLADLHLAIEEKEKLIEKIKEVELSICSLKDNIEETILQDDPEVNYLFLEIRGILGKNILVDRENEIKIKEIKEELSRQLNNLNSINQGVKKYFSLKKPQARFLDKRR
ncbi:MAG: hypothetical protein V1872_05365 [bacterium]